MHIVNFLFNHSFNYKNDISTIPFDSCVDKLDKVTEYCSNHKMPIFFDVNIYDEEILPSIYFGNWLYNTFDRSENETEKSIFREIFDKKCTIDPSPWVEEVNSFEICFYEIPKDRDSIVQGLQEWLDHRRYLLSEITDKNNFESELGICFPELVFSEDIHAGLNSLTRFGNWVKDIVLHLSILNDHGQTLLLEFGEAEAIKAIESMLPKGAECSGQNSEGRDKLFFKFKTSLGKDISIDCFPHTKLISAYSDGRIYFRFRHNLIADNKKILIGRIGTHID